jgi:hypothetical protein
MYINVYLYAGGTRKNLIVLQTFVMPSSATAMNIWVTHHALSSPLLLTDVTSHSHRSEVTALCCFSHYSTCISVTHRGEMLYVNKSRKFGSSLKHMLVLK